MVRECLQGTQGLHPVASRQTTRRQSDTALCQRGGRILPNRWQSGRVTWVFFAVEEVGQHRRSVPRGNGQNQQSKFSSSRWTPGRKLRGLWHSHLQSVPLPEQSSSADGRKGSRDGRQAEHRVMDHFKRQQTLGPGRWPEYSVRKNGHIQWWGKFR